MVPLTWLSVLFFIFLIAPGLLYDLLDQRHHARVSESAFREASRTVLAGLIVSCIAVSILAVVRAVRPAWMPNPTLLISHPGSYFAVQYRLILRALLIEGALALAIAGTFQAIRNSRSDARLRPVSTWTRVFRHDCPEGSLPHVQVKLTNGMNYIGQVGHFTADLETAERELVLVPPLYVKKPNGVFKDISVEWQRVVLSGECVQSMVVQYRPDPRRRKPSQSRRISLLGERIQIHFSSRKANLSLPGREDTIHCVGSLDQDRPDLLTVNGFGSRGTAMADQPGDVLNGNASVGHQRDETVP
jgi:Family of unknown function (DUF6338)